ncbi:chlorohydrolase [Streptococcus pneumoniae]|nr:chlorohydrolase [Streptococcus pneumoniae]
MKLTKSAQKELTKSAQNTVLRWHGLEVVDRTDGVGSKHCFEVADKVSSKHCFRGCR